jgi:RNA polymerase sigma-70 factor (ECF subfamily)
MAQTAAAAGRDQFEQRFLPHRPELIAHCYRMMASPFEAEDAVQETFIRAWRGYEGFEGRSQLRSWLYKIATNVCLDMLRGRERRARPMDLSGEWDPAGPIGRQLPEVTWVEPLPDALVAPAADDPAAAAEAHEAVGLALVAALQQLPPRQRAALILCEVLRWKATEVAELLDTSVASINSALQRARATLEEADVAIADQAPDVSPEQRELLDRYVEAFEAYDMEALTELIRDDALQSMPPYELWLQGRDRILDWWNGPGAACRGSRMIPVADSNGRPAFGQYRVAPDPADGHRAWGLHVLQLDGPRIGEFTMFLDVERVFPLFGLPLELPVGSPAPAVTGVSR